MVPINKRRRKTIITSKRGIPAKKQKKETQMAISYNAKLTEGFPYIVESERSEKKPFTVIVQPIDSVRLVQLEDGLLKRSQDNSLSISTGSYNVSLCRNAITGWANMNDENGKAINIVLDIKGYISEESLSQLPTALITEVAGMVAAVSQDPSQVQIFTQVDE